MPEEVYSYGREECRKSFRSYALLKFPIKCLMCLKWELPITSWPLLPRKLLSAKVSEERTTSLVLSPGLLPLFYGN